MATPRRRMALGVLAAVAWAVSRAGLADVVNTRGWPSFAKFWRAALSPEIGGEFLRLTFDAAKTTLAYAVLGTLLSLVIGLLLAPALSERVTGGGGLWRSTRALMVVPRAVHEILWALLLVQVFGFDPIVAVLAIGVPFGAVTAKVFAEAIDDTPPDAYLTLRASGASPLSALSYGVLPTVGGDLVSYAFYRFECAIRSAAVLGVIGAGGLGFQLDLSFESLRYDEIWTLIFALMVLSGAADAWSSAVRRSRAPGGGRASLLVAAFLVPASWAWVDLDVSVLWAERTRRLAADLASDLVPFRLGPGGWSTLVEATIDTAAMSVLAVVAAAALALVLGTLAHRPTLRTSAPSSAAAAMRWLIRLLLLLCRAVPAPIWAFLMVLVFFPGIWPGALGLAIYNAGVLGRLYGEAIEDGDPAGADALALTGASPVEAFCYATLPASAARLVSLTLYRWEVIVRETVVVGVVGAGGLGQLINEHLAARDFAAVGGAIVAIVVLSFAIDALSALLRRRLR